jgi:hypothetical protein
VSQANRLGPTQALAARAGSLESDWFRAGIVRPVAASASFIAYAAVTGPMNRIVAGPIQWDPEINFMTGGVNTY